MVSRSERDAFVLHYSTGEELGREDCAAWVRTIQRFHMGPERGWADIGYNFLVCKHGDVFEGRGWDYVGAHAPGWNVRGIGVCYLGDDDPNSQDAPLPALRAIRDLWVLGEGYCGPLRRVTHRATQPGGYTACPGDELAAWLAAGMPVAASPPPFPGRVLRLLPERMRGADVRTWQHRMRERGWDIGVDGVFGPQSHDVAREFQRRKGLPVDGAVGPSTWRAAWS